MLGKTLLSVRALYFGIDFAPWSFALSKGRGTDAGMRNEVLFREIRGIAVGDARLAEGALRWMRFRFARHVCPEQKKYMTWVLILKMYNSAQHSLKI